MTTDGSDTDGDENRPEATGSGEWCFEDLDCHPTVEVGDTEYPVVACRHDSGGVPRDDFIVRDLDGNHRLIIFDVDGVVVVDKPYFLPNI